MSSIAAQLVPGLSANNLDLPMARRYVLLLVDGLGWDCLFDAQSNAPVLQGLAAERLQVGLPSTTATSLTSLVTGVPAGEHGIVGFSFRTRDSLVMNTMIWDDPQSPPEQVQPVPTWFERLRHQVRVCAVVPAIFADSGLTRAYLRGAELLGVANEKDWTSRVTGVAMAAAEHELTFVYERSLDHVAHIKGWHSSRWLATLAAIDRFVADLLDSLPANTCLLVTGDHGMVDVPKTHRVFIEDTPVLAADIDMIGGEARLRHLYTHDPASVAARWAAWLGSRAQVLPRAEALAWFGEQPPGEAVIDRIGDVVVAMQGDWAALTWGRPKEVSLVGMHGSSTAAECVVPLLKGES